MIREYLNEAAKKKKAIPTRLLHFLPALAHEF